MPGEFEIINRYFRRESADASIRLGIGDDAAVLDPVPSESLVVATDMLVAGRHFPENTPAHALGHRVLAVNLSDLAAVAAKPRWALLQLALPEAEEQWLEAFAAGMFGLATRHQVSLVGGDTVKGPLAVGMTVLGSVRDPVRRSGARPGEIICVTGNIGDALLGLQVLNGALPEQDFGKAKQVFLYPEPRIELGIALAGLMSAAIDVSDGLLADAGKLVAQSGIGGVIEIDSVPLSKMAETAKSRGIPIEQLLDAGDDYELCFTVPESRLQRVLELAAEHDTPVTPIGRTEAAAGMRFSKGGTSWQPVAGGFDHFKETC